MSLTVISLILTFPQYTGKLEFIVVLSIIIINYNALFQLLYLKISLEPCFIVKYE